MCYHIVAARMGSTVPACSTVPRTPWYGILSCSRCLQHLYLLAWSCRRDGAFVGDDRPGLGWAGLDVLAAMVCLVVYTALVCICFSRGSPMRPGVLGTPQASPRTQRLVGPERSHISSMPCHAMPCLPGLHRDALPCIAIYFNVAVGCHPPVQPTPGHLNCTQWSSQILCTRPHTRIHTHTHTCL